MRRRRTPRALEPRLHKLITFERRRQLRPSEIAQMAVNICRRYPHRHDQDIECSANNKACMVGWCEAVILRQEPSYLARIGDSTNRRLLKKAGASPGVGTLEFVAERLKVDYAELEERVWSESDPEDAISAFCSITGAIDPGPLAKDEAA